jgi:hypothetical protein
LHGDPYARAAAADGCDTAGGGAALERTFEQRRPRRASSPGMDVEAAARYACRRGSREPPSPGSLRLPLTVSLVASSGEFRGNPRECAGRCRSVRHAKRHRPSPSVTSRRWLQSALTESPQTRHCVGCPPSPRCARLTSRNSARAEQYESGGRHVGGARARLWVCELPGLGHERSGLVKLHAAREPRKNIAEVKPQVETNQSARAENRVGDRSTFAAGV